MANSVAGMAPLVVYLNQPFFLDFYKITDTLSSMKSTLEAADLFDRLDRAGFDYGLFAEFVNKQLGTNAVYVGDGLFEVDEEERREPDDSMDGDFDSGMASAGHGTDEDYEHNSCDEGGA